MKIIFVDLHAASYTCEMPYTRPLGGTQSAVAYLAAALARRGHGITVLNDVPDPASSMGVDFVGHDRLAAAFLNQFDAVVMVSAALGRELRAAGVSRPLVLWCHHHVDQPAVAALAMPTERAAWSGYAMVTRWQGERYAESFAVPAHQQRVLGNAISPVFEGIAPKRSWLERAAPPVLYYTSTPFRGLAVLLDAMPAIRAGAAGALLRVYSGDLYGAGTGNESYRQLLERCRSTPGVEHVGPVPQKALVEALQSADVHAYPSTFPETSCIAVMESMAAGSLIVSVRLGAIEETAAGFASLMDLPADPALLASQFAAHMVRTLSEAARDPAALASRLSAQRQFALENYRWERRAEEWEGWLERDILQARQGPAGAARPSAESYKAEGNMLKAGGDREGAIARYRRSLELEADYVPALYNLGVMYHEAGRFADAERPFRRCTEIDPSDRDAFFRLGLVLGELARHAEAVEAYRAALGTDAGNPLLWLELGRNQKALGQTTEATTSLRKALGLAPRLDEAHNLLGLLLQEAGALDEAIRHYGEAAALAPGEGAYFNNLGCALGLSGRLEPAIANLSRAIELKPTGDAHRNLAEIYSVQGKRDLALKSYEAAYQLAPGDPAVGAGLLFARQQVCEWKGLDELCEVRRRALSDGAWAHLDPFGLLSAPFSAAEQLQGARAHAARISSLVAEDRGRLGFSFGRVRRGKLKIGYLSADFHEHATAYLMAELFELHDRGRFEVSAYSYGPDDGSPMRARLERAFDRFTDVRQLSHADAARAIFRDRVDVLVDLKGYTTYARPQIPALRPAPIQVSYIGYPGTMGAEFIDYLIGDHVVTPPEHASHYSEKIVRVSGCYQVNDRRRPRGEAPSRQALGLPQGKMVFFCFNQSYKILPETFESWMRILAAAPDSVLWLLEWNHEAAANLRREASSRGIDPGRLVFSPLLAHREHLARIGAADLLLDTLPYNAHTVASDALWCGVPVLTLQGETFASRVAASQLVAAGLPQLVARSRDEYEEVAIRLARDPQERAALRDKLARARGSCALFDTPKFTHDLEAAYERMWETYAAGSPPADIDL